ncbi:MAG: exodeoxyribonuclease VII small subunit [Lachnospiraceae bacterium]|nr:exodeoxyribonuclease VII small subunit [Lachnospiraceae bacterium]
MAGTKTLEQSLEELDAIVEQMGRQDITLEEAFKLYHQGIKLCKSCNDKIDKVEKKIEMIHENEESAG